MACGRVAGGLIVGLSSLGCSIRSNGPHWIETHGHAQVQRVAGGPLGLLAIGTNGLIYSYPEFGSVWHEWNGRLHPRMIAGSRRGLVYADQDSRVGKGDHGRVGAPDWNLGGAVTALATDEDGDALYAIADGHISRLLESGAVPGPCGERHAVSIAIARGQLWVSDGQHVYLGSDASCQPAPGAPSKVLRLCRPRLARLCRRRGRRCVSIQSGQWLGAVAAAQKVSSRPNAPFASRN